MPFLFQGYRVKASGQVEADTIAADTSPKGRDMIGNNRKDSARTTERSLTKKPHHGIRGKSRETVTN